MMDEEIRQAVSEVREMKQMCGNINMKLTNIVTQRGQDWKKKLEAEYQRGLDDAWKCARELYLNGACKDLFGEYFNTFIKIHTAQEAIEKLKAYEEKQKADNEIKVGDEVYAYTPSGKTRPFVIIKIYDEDGVKYYSGINADGNHVQGGLNYIKTGRHFPHVVELLKAMKE